MAQGISEVYYPTMPTAFDSLTTVGSEQQHASVDTYLQSTKYKLKGRRILDKDDGRLYKLHVDTTASSVTPSLGDNLSTDTHSYDDNRRFYSGDRLPSVALGHNIGLVGDVYLNTSTGDWFVKKSGGTFGTWSTTPDFVLEDMVGTFSSDVTLTGTSNQINVGTATDYVLSLSSTLQLPGTLQVGSTSTLEASTFYGNVDVKLQSTSPIFSVNTSPFSPSVRLYNSPEFTVYQSGSTDTYRTFMVNHSDDQVSVRTYDLSVYSSGSGAPGESSERLKVTASSGTLQTVGGIYTKTVGGDIDDADTLFSVAPSTGNIMGAGEMTIDGATTLGSTCRIYDDLTVGSGSLSPNPGCTIFADTGNVDTIGDVIAEGNISCDGYAKAGINDDAGSVVDRTIDLSEGNTHYYRVSAGTGGTIDVDCAQTMEDLYNTYLGGSFIFSVYNDTTSSVTVTFDSTNNLFFGLDKIPGGGTTTTSVTLAENEGLTYSGVIMGDGVSHCYFMGTLGDLYSNLLG